MRVANTASAVLLALICMAQARAQEGPLQWHFGGGYSITTGTTGKYLDNGWMLSGGLTWTPQPGGPLAFMAELHYSSYGATNELLRLGNLQTNTERIDDGWGSILGGDINGVYRVPLGPRARGYVTAGIGEYYRKTRLSETVLVAGTYCDPWWGICYQGVAPGQAIVADESTTRFAWNAGVGVEFPTGRGGAWFIDVRYHELQTKQSTAFIPIQIGVRF